jgi:4,5-DOPA dioxygenase extradiol
MVAWDKLQVPGYGYDWAIEANESMKKHLRSGNHQALIDFNKQGRAWNLAIPTPEHYLPLLYTLGMARSHEPLHLFNDETLGGSLSMTSVMVG